MASRIQGITVEIGGDTTKLSTALSKVNKEIRDTQSQLKDVNKLLKLDPGNAELMAQKQRLLAQAVSETKEKLDALKLAGQQANEALAKGEISQGQYDALQREIIETEHALRDLERQANQSSVALQKIGAAGEKLQNVGSAIEGAGQKLMPVTAAVGGLATAAVKVASDFDSAMSQVAAVSGATGKELDALRDKAREMGSKTKFSASEAMNYMAMAGWKTGDMLDGIEGIMNLAAASGEDLATTSDIVTDALTALGLSAADSGHFADILAAASSNANTNVSLMGETFKYCAPVAGALGFTAEDTAEIDCHGGRLVMQKILEAVLKHGARVAEPGEFTKRAFLNGRMDLSQAEAVMDLIQSKNEMALKSSLAQLKGTVRQEIEKLRAQILYEMAFVEHLLDSLVVGARCIVIVPQSSMTGKTKEEQSIKENILKHHTLEGVISLNIPYVSSSTLCNGVDNFIANTEKVRIFSNCISLANSGSVGSSFYEPFAFVASDHVTHLKNKRYNKYHYLFIASIMNRLSQKYNFNREINDNRISREKIMLPINADGNLDLDFMEQYIKERESQLVQKCKDYIGEISQSGGRCQTLNR